MSWTVLSRCYISNTSRSIIARSFSKYHQKSHHSPEFRSDVEVNDLLAEYASSPPRPINLSQLLSFGRPVNRDSVLSSVSYTLSEIPRRLATRVRSLEDLPYIVGTNPYIAQALRAYKNSFLWLATHPPVENLEQNAVFVEQLAGIVQRHTNDIPTMAKGFQESARYMSPTEMNLFLDGAIRNRISVRLIAEQHILVSQALDNPEQTNTDHVGVVDMQCSPKKMIKMCSSYVSELCEATLGSSPSVIIDGYADATFSYVPVHLEYILTEVLKNSFRATVEHSQKFGRGRQQPPPVIITLSPPSRADAATLESTYFSIRVRDQGGGVSPTNMAKIFSYAFTTAGRGASTDDDRFENEKNEEPIETSYEPDDKKLQFHRDGLFHDMTGTALQTGLGTIAGLGYGLPMTKLYAKYFGGSLNFKSLEGWGSDMFLRLRCLDEAGDSKI